MSGFFLPYKELREGHKQGHTQPKKKKKKCNFVFVKMKCFIDLPNPSYINMYNILMEFY